MRIAARAFSSSEALQAARYVGAEADVEAFSSAARARRRRRRNRRWTAGNGRRRPRASLMRSMSSGVMKFRMGQHRYGTSAGRNGRGFRCVGDTVAESTKPCSQSLSEQWVWIWQPAVAGDLAQAFERRIGAGQDEARGDDGMHRRSAIVGVREDIVDEIDGAL